jgi:transglutaminase-like putative cysteine protease
VLEGSRRRLLAASVPVAAVTFAWASIEISPRVLAFAGVAALAVTVALPSRALIRVGVALAILVGLTIALAGSSVGAVREVVDQALSDIYAVAPPFIPASHSELHTLVILTACDFCLAIAVTAGDRPFVAAAITAAGLGWPATILPARNTIAMGMLGLLAALWPVVIRGLRDRRGLVPGAAMLAGLVVAAAVLAGAGARPSVAALDWKNWDLFGESGAGRTVSLVWRSDYGGIDFPAGKTTVLRIKAPRRALYWRATTLDTFASDHWVETLYATGSGVAAQDLPADPLLPAAAARRSDWVKQEVSVRALVDDHVVAAGQPMALSGGQDRRIRFLSGGVMSAPDGLTDLRHYTVWSYAPRPTPAALLRSPPAYPESLARYLDVGRTVVPRFGAPGRVAAVNAIFHDDLYQELWPYKPMWTEGRRLTARATSPYEATVTIERWLRTVGGFRYDEHPPYSGPAPPLVDFLEQTKLGYCQQFAGTMALMLRYLGIPARVAVGFTSGTWKDGTWTVTDHDAHAWVEAWFAGQGWLTFDPTPGRGTLSATYTNASDSADAIRALGTGEFLGAGFRVTRNAGKPVTPLEQPTNTGIPWRLVVPFAVVAAALLILALVKSVTRYRRARTSDPRRRASAARAELAAFVRDQGSEVSSSASVGELGLELRRLGVGSDAFAAAFSRARYGPPGDAARAADETRRELRRVISLLRARLGPGRRARGFLAVRSLRGDASGTMET